MFIFLLSLVGIPLTAGFVGKFFVFGATIQHQYYFLAIMAVDQRGHLGFLLHEPGAHHVLRPARMKKLPASGAPGIGAQVIVIVCVLGVFWIGLYPPNVIEWANSASQYLLTIL